MKKSTHIKKTIDYIENHLDEDIKLETIAKAVGYSKYHLNRMFAESTGQTIHRYIRERRLEKAADNLVHSEKSIVEIAFEAGYESQQAFTLAFRQLYYYTPMVYRNIGILNTRQRQDKSYSYFRISRKFPVKNRIFSWNGRVMAA